MKEKIRNKPVKKYDRYRPAEEYKVGDVLYFEAIRDWDSGGKIITDGVYGEIIDIKETKDGQKYLEVDFSDYRAFNEKFQPSSPREFIVGLVREEE
ncbi:MAG: hypothetical protein ACK4G3_04020 [bacterium]